MNPNQSTDYAPYPKIDPNDVAPTPAPASAGDSWTSVPVGSQPDAPSPPPPTSGQPMYTGAPRTSDTPPQSANPMSVGGATTMPSESNPYISPSPVPESATKSEYTV